MSKKKLKSKFTTINNYVFNDFYAYFTDSYFSVYEKYL